MADIGTERRLLPAEEGREHLAVHAPGIGVGQKDVEIAGEALFKREREVVHMDAEAVRDAGAER